MRGKRKILHSFRYETLEAKIRYMLSLPLAERYAQGLDFAEIISLSGKNIKYRNAREAFSTVQVIKKK